MNIHSQLLSYNIIYETDLCQEEEIKTEKISHLEITDVIWVICIYISQLSIGVKYLKRQFAIFFISKNLKVLPFFQTKTSKELFELCHSLLCS